MTHFLLLAQLASDHTLLGTIFTGAYALAGAALTALLGFGTKVLAERAKSSRSAAFLALVYAKASAIVAYVEVHIRPDVDKDLADGKLTAQEAAELKTRALALFKESLGEQGLDKVSGLLGLFGPSVDRFLSGVLEQALGVKQGAVAANPLKAP